jgi:5'-nucleotidase
MHPPNLTRSKVYMKNLFSATFIVLLLLLTACGSPQAGAASPGAEASSTQPSTAVPKTPTPALPALRTPQVRDALPASGSVEIHILHWNDFHGELVERITPEGAWVPGGARLAAYVQTAVEQYGRQNVLLLDAGDWFENTDLKGENRANKGRAVLAFYRRLGVDAITVGNHDLFLGPAFFREVVAGAAPMQILSVNLRVPGPNHTCTDKPIINPYQVYELGEPDGPKVRVAVIGISIQGLELLAYHPISGACFTDPVAELEKIYDGLMADEKPDVVVLVSHSGFDVDRQIAEALTAAGKPVDLIIGGHSHTWIEAPERVGATTVVQAGDLGRAIGDFDLVYDRASDRLRVDWKQELFTSASRQDQDTLDFIGASGYVSEVPTIAPKDPSHSYLIDMQPASQSVGFWSLGKGIFPATEAAMLEGQTIFSHGKEYRSGLFAHSPSDLRYALDGKFASFQTEISIQESACGDGASFAVLLDGKEIYDSGTMLPTDAPRPVELDVNGGKLLVLKTVPGSDMSCDWTIWGDPYLVAVP